MWKNLRFTIKNGFWYHGISPKEAAKYHDSMLWISDVEREGDSLTVELGADINDYCYWWKFDGKKAIKQFLSLMHSDTCQELLGKSITCFMEGYTMKGIGGNCES